MQDTLVFGASGFIGEYVMKQMPVDTHAVNSKTSEKEVLRLIQHARRILWLVPPAGILEKMVSELQKNTGLERFLYVSTLLLYPGSEKPVSETAIIAPHTPYERAKSSEEEMLVATFVRAPEKLIIARLANVYGDVKNTGVIGKIFSTLKTDATLAINGDGSQRRDFIHVDDAARLLVGLFNAKDAAGTYNVSTGESHAVSEIITRIENIGGKKLNVSYGGSSEKKTCVVGDNAKLSALLHPQPCISLDTGLKKAYTCYL